MDHVLMKVGLKVSCFGAEHCEHAPYQYPSVSRPHRRNLVFPLRRIAVNTS